MLSIKNKSSRGIGYACGSETVVIEPGETKPVPIEETDPRVVGEMHAGTIEIVQAPASAPKVAKPAASSDGKGQ